MKLFEVPGSDVLNTNLGRVLDEIRALQNDYVLNASPTELEQNFIDKATLNPLTLKLDAKTIANRRSTHYEFPSHRGYHSGPGPTVPATTFQIAVPFEGDPQLLRCRPSRYSLRGGQDAEVKGGQLLVEFTFPDESANPDKLRQEVEEALDYINKNVEQLAADVQLHNNQVPARVHEVLEAKRQKALRAMDAVAGLGIPMQRVEPPAYVVPAVRKQRPVSLPPAQKGTFEPEPVLEGREYDYILSVARNMSKVIERSPTTFAHLEEEAIRDHFLIALNSHYEGKATGETFNAEGKTDILLRDRDRNVFIAECKIWKGQKNFNDAIDQLLGYLTWRDCKCAIFVFNRNRDSTAVAGKMHEVMQARAEHRKTVSHSIQGDSQYVFVKESEPGREIIITTQLYDVPSPTPQQTATDDVVTE